MEILDIGIKTVESNDCRVVLRDDRDTNSMLATMQKKQDLSTKIDRSLLTHCYGTLWTLTIFILFYFIFSNFIWILFFFSVYFG